MITHIRIFITGMLMGLADLVPGVSGGTIVFLSGFYERFINALAEIAPTTVGFLRNRDFTLAFKRVDGKFLTVLFGGIGLSLALFSELIHYLLQEKPGIIWSIFFGLVLGSVIIIGIPIEKKTKNIVSFIIGATLGIVISNAIPNQLDSVAYPLLFLAGSVAICAMILPGLSGSYILLLLGFYEPIIEIIRERDFAAIITIALGCCTGLILFANILRWLLATYPSIMLSFLIGIMAGGLLKIWPYNASEHITTNPALMIAFGVLGACAVLIIERLGKNVTA